MAYQTVHAIKIYLDEVFETDYDFGILTPSYINCKTTMGSNVIYNFGNTWEVIDGRKVRVSAGFPSSTELYTVLSHTSSTVTIDTNATSTETEVTVEQQSEVRKSEIWLIWSGGLLKDLFDNIKEGGDLSRGGAPVSYDGLTVNFKNTTQDLLTLKNKGIYLTGKKAEIYRFVGTPDDPDLIERSVIFTGICEDLQWTETTISIPIKNDLFKRNADMSTSITEGNNAGSVVSITFGKIYPSSSETVDRLAKFMRTLDSSIELSDDYFTGSGLTESKIFPVTELTSTTRYVCKLRTDSIGSPSSPVDIYAEVVSGLSAAIGQRRLVTAWTLLSTVDGVFIRFDIDEVFINELSITGDDRSWVKFVQRIRSYNADIWPCKSFLKSTDGTETDLPELFTYNSTDARYERIADFGFIITSADNNSLDIDGSQYADDIDSLESFIISPITSLALVNSSTLEDWNFGGTFDGSTWEKKIDGIYGDQDWSGKVTVSGSLTNAARAYDRDSTTYAEHSITFDVSTSGTRRLVKMLKFGLPAFPKDANVNKVYLGIKMYSATDKTSFFQGSDAVGSILAMFRRFAYSLSNNNVFTSQRMDLVEEGAVNTIADLLDNYFSDNPSTNSIDFYKTHNAVDSPYYLSGYTLFEIPNCSKEIYNSFIEGGLAFCRFVGTIGYHSDVTKIFDLAIIFQIAQTSIEREVYSPLAGRIYDDTWGGRKTPEDMILDPIDMIECLKRLGNWSGTGVSLNFGKEYSSTAKIKTSGEGSYDDSSLADVKLRRPSFQVLEAREQWTNELTKEFCDTFGVCTYIDKDGYECIKQLQKEDVSEDITLADIVGEVSEVIEPKSSDIFCEPIVNYEYDCGRGAFNKQLKITNITASAWQSSYTPGFEDADGQVFWDLCKRLYLQFGTVEKVPSDFSDKKMISTYADALFYLNYKLWWLSKKRISITIKYSKGKDYHFAKHVNLKLPHQTDDIYSEAVIERIVKSKKNVSVKLDLVLIEDKTRNIIQDVAIDESPDRGIYQEKVEDLLIVKQNRAGG